MASGATLDLQRAGEQVQSHSAALPKELGFPDIVLASILLVVVVDFFGTAVQAGPAHWVLWIVAIVLFFIPQAAVVSHLSRIMPLEGGLYEWARLAFNDIVGFLVAWNLWLFVVVYFAIVGLVTVTFAAYAIGPQAAWMASNKWLVFASSGSIITILVFLSRLGLGVSKWLSNLGSASTVLTISVLAAMPLVHSWSGSLPEYHPFRWVSPPLNLFTLSLFSKMTFGALCGFEYVAIFAGECRSPARSINRAIWVAAPVIAFLYILGTSAILTFVPSGAGDVVAPIPQALIRAFSGFGIAGVIAPLAILLLLTNYLSTFCVQFNGNARLPMVAGWDRLLPAWFTRLHPKHKTPVNSIYFAGGITLAASVGVLFGVKLQEAYQLLLIWSFTFYAIAYLALFAIPLFARNKTGIRPKIWLRILATSGFFVTLLFVILSIFPIVPVQDETGYAAKTIAVVVLANFAGVLLYRAGRRSARNT